MRDFDYIILGGGCAGLSLAYELEINGKTIPAAVKPATVADPTQTLITVAINHANINGDTKDPSSKDPIQSLTPLSIKICFNAPAPDIIKSTIVILDTEIEIEFINSFIFFPLDNPRVYIATRTEISMAITGLPINKIISLINDSEGNTIVYSEENIINITGNSAVNTLTPILGI